MTGSNLKPQDSVNVTDRLELVKVKTQIIEHAARHSASVEEAVADIATRGALLAMARSLPPIAIMKGTAKLIQAYKEIIVEGLVATLNDEEGRKA